MTRDEWAKKLEVWATEYGDVVPLDEIRSVVLPSAEEYLRHNYEYNAFMNVMLHRGTGKAQTGQNISMGAGYSPITRSRGEWILRMGTNPWRVGRDDDGRLWAKDNRDAEKVYAT